MALTRKESDTPESREVQGGVVAALMVSAEYARVTVCDDK